MIKTYIRIFTKMFDKLEYKFLSKEVQSKFIDFYTNEDTLNKEINISQCMKILSNLLGEKIAEVYLKTSDENEFKIETKMQKVYDLKLIDADNSTHDKRIEIKYEDSYFVYERQPYSNIYLLSSFKRVTADKTIYILKIRDGFLVRAFNASSVIYNFSKTIDKNSDLDYVYEKLIKQLSLEKDIDLSKENIQKYLESKISEYAK
ncbi:MAG: hypothetical protein RR751_05850 [Clostridia bacterium]